LGQKVHPTGFRIGIIKPWLSNWYAEKNYASQLHEDLALRKYIKKTLSHAGVSKIEIERRTKQVRINIHAARPGIIIGKKGAEVDQLKASLAKMIEGKIDLSLNILEIRRPELDSTLVAENIALQLEKRIAFRRAMKKSVVTAMRFGAKGIRINCSGRLGGAEIARMEWYREGRVPLHTIRADIDYGVAEAHTTFGIIGIKVWLFHGEIIKRRGRAGVEIAEPVASPRGDREAPARKRDA
jgi:small subunit ribosomal protein S3